MKKFLYLVCLLPILLTTSCSRFAYFTRPNKESVDKSGMDLKNIQFYNDRRLQLRRVVSSEEAKLIGGKIRFIDGEYISIAYLRRFTPGVCEEAPDNKLIVKFENGNDRTLTFQCDQRDAFNYFKVGPSKRPDLDKEHLLYSVVADKYEMINSHRYAGKIKYDNLDYTLRFRLHHAVRYFGQAPFIPALLVRRDHSLNFRLNRRRIKGKRVSE